MAVTQMDVRVMTPEHASPEQIRSDSVTTVSDVYALGVCFTSCWGTQTLTTSSRRA